jgi:IS5 family transposase
MSRTPQKATYRVRNWAQYDKALIDRGSLTIWVDQESLDSWHHDGPPRWGARFVYSDVAIQLLLTLRAVFRLPLRATQGMARSIFDLMGLDLDVPHYTTLCRRAATARIELPKTSEGPVHLVLDSTGMKVYGEGEWKVRRHGYSKRRTWLKLHLGVDADTHEIQAAAVTEAGVTDGEAAPALLDQVEREVTAVGGDGAYDQAGVYEAVARRGARAVIPPRKGARIKAHGNTRGEPDPRDANLRGVRRLGRKGWKRESGYHRRSLAETAMGRIKGLFGAGLRSREWLRQAAELGVRCRALNIMTHLGMPVTVKVV